MLTVVTVHYNQLGLLRIMTETMRQTASGPVRFLVCDNGSTKAIKKKLLAYAEDKDMKVVFNKQPDLGKKAASLYHGLGLNAAIDSIDDPEETICITEIDSFWLYPGWDEAVVEPLKNHLHVSTNRPKTPHLPTVFLTVAKRKTFSEFNVDFRPRLIEYDEKVPKKQRYQIVSPAYDTGWEMKNVPDWKVVRNVWLTEDGIVGGEKSDLACKMMGTQTFVLDDKKLAVHLRRGWSKEKKHLDRHQVWVGYCLEYCERNGVDIDLSRLKGFQ